MQSAALHCLKAQVGILKYLGMFKGQKTFFFNFYIKQQMTKSEKLDLQHFLTFYFKHAVVQKSSTFPRIMALKAIRAMR